MQLISYIQILRPVNLLISIICTCSSDISSLSSSLSFSNSSNVLLFLMLVVFLLGGFSNIINDILDYKIDLTNNVNRPIANNKISIKAAFLYALLLFCLAFYLTLNFNVITQSLIFFVIVPLMILYTPVFKKIPLLGNFVVSAILSMVFIITSTYLLAKVHFSIIPPIIFSFF